MAFVNEFVPHEDIKRYDLDELWNSYHPWNKIPSSGFRHSWTVNRERDIFLMLVKTVEEVGRSGLNEPSNQRIFILCWQGKRIVIQLRLAEGSSSNVKSLPFKQIWNLVSLDIPQSVNEPRDEIIKTLKEALATFGFDGANWQVPNTIVEFNF